MGPVVEVDGKDLVGWGSFHRTFATLLGFPDYYGKNMDAWVDCMSYLDDPLPNQTNITLKQKDVLTLQVRNWRYLKTHGKEEWEALTECSAFVNARRIEGGQRAILALSLGSERQLEE